MTRRNALGRIVSLARPELGRLVLATISLLGTATLSLSYPYFVRVIVDGLLGESAGGAETVRRAASTLVGLFVVGGILTAARSYLFTVSGERIVANLRQRLYASVLHQEVAFFDEHRTGELTSRLSSDTTVLQKAVTVNLSMLLRYGLMGLGALGILVWSSMRLTAVMLSVIPLVVVLATFFGRKLRRVARLYQDALAASTEVAEETFAGIRTVRAFAREGQEEQRYDRAVEKSFELAEQRARIGAAFSGAAVFSGYAAIGVVLWNGGVMLTEGQMTVGELSAFLLYTFTVSFSMAALVGLWEDFAKAVGASERVFELLDREAAVQSGGLRLDAVAGDVILDGVDFAYPVRPDAPVLCGLSLRLAPGQVVAIVGPSGAGKSTIAALLSRFYDPQEGQVRLDDTPLTELDPCWLREQIGVVAQEPVLFATSIEDNIRYGRPEAEADGDAVREAARAANAHEFIEGFPEGYCTLVGERGVRLSGGQKQRVAIARALLKDPVVLILDEATSALDAESEHLVQGALERLMRGRTTLVIAHRLSTVKQADRVLVLDEGRIVQEGTHAELVGQEGLYRQLVKRQFAAA